MPNLAQHSTCILNRSVRSTASTLLVACALAMLIGLPVQAQTFAVIHYFSGPDGYDPWELTIDQAGNLYGATLLGGQHNDGVVFKMTKHGSAWTLVPLYNFDFTQNGGDGSGPYGVVFGPSGKLYGTTNGGGWGYGTVFSLAPPPSSCHSVLCPWTETQLHLFTGGSGDGADPGNADLAFDQSGNIYGTTVVGGSGSCNGGCGTVYELSQKNGVWTSSILYSFPGYFQEFAPRGGLVFDRADNLYGTAAGGVGGGSVYELTPQNGSWSTSIIASLGGPEGVQPDATLLIDSNGDLFGTAQGEGKYQNGTAFELTPSNGGWNFNLLYSFSGLNVNDGPQTPLTQDAAGNLYGTNYGGGALGYGNVFKLTHSNGSWTYTSLHDFSGSDGWGPESKVVIDAQGNLYGTTVNGGPENPACGGSGASCGVVWEITGVGAPHN